jgi:hypothetical protein
MKVRQVGVTGADIASARLLFKTMSQYWDMGSWSVLDPFARTGVLTVDSYKDSVKFVTAWELGGEHYETLSEKVDQCTTGGCSYEWLDTLEPQHMPDEKYEMIVVDSPQGIHLDYRDRPCCEHFDVIPMLGRWMAETCVLVLYVNLEPYDVKDEGSQGYDEYDEYDFDAWMARRTLYYGTQNITVGSALDAYGRELSQIGKRITNTMVAPCFSDIEGKEPYAVRIALELR